MSEFTKPLESPPPAMSGKDFKGDEVAHLEDVEASDSRSQNILSRNRNVSAKIQNPLKGLSKQRLFQIADEFCSNNGFEDKRDLFKRASLVAQNPNEYDGIPELTDDDKHWIRRETTHKWSQSWALYYLVIVCSLGSAIQGWDNTGSNGATLSWPSEFGITSNHWLVGAINAAPALVVGTISAPLADPLNNLLGRRGVVFVTGLFCVFPVLGQAFTRNWYELFICRCLIGLGMGVKISTIPVYTAETAPASIRGALTMSFQLWVAAGILIGFSSNLIFMDVGPRSWRYQLGAAFAPAVPLLFMCWFAPESPRWLMKKGRYQKAYRAFCRLRMAEIQAARDMFYAHCQLVEEQELFRGTTLLSRFRDIFTVPRLRRANLASWTIMISQQLCGINIMAFYSSTIFVEAGYSVRQALLASFGFGLVNTAFAFPAIWTIDTFGRRNLLLLFFPVMALCLFWAGSMFYLDESNPARVPVLALAIYLYTAAYSPSIGPVPFVYAAEVFDLGHREIGMSFAVQQNNFWSSVLGLTFPSLLAKIGASGAFYFYASTNILAFVMIIFLVPETSKLTLEELDYVFAVPVSVFAKYQWNTFIPYVFRKYVLFQRDCKLEPLYKLDGVQGERTVVERYH